MKSKKKFLILLFICFLIIMVICINYIKSNDYFFANNKNVPHQNISSSRSSSNNTILVSPKKSHTGVIADYQFTVNRVSQSKHGEYIVNIFDFMKGDQPNTLLPDYSFLFLSVTIENLSSEEKSTTLANQKMQVYPKDETVIPYENMIESYEAVGADIWADALESGETLRTANHITLPPHGILDITIVYPVKDKYLNNDLYLCCNPNGHPDEKLNEDGNLIQASIPMLYLSDLLEKVEQ